METKEMNTEIENMNKFVFSNIDDMLHSLPERERNRFIAYLEKKDIRGNKTLEENLLFQYNTSLYSAMTYAKLQSLQADIEKKVSMRGAELDKFMTDFQEAINTHVNRSIGEINAGVSDVLANTSLQVARMNDTLIHLMDNISAYIDTSVSKMLDQVADERTKNVNELTAFSDALKEQLKSEIQGMILEISKEIIPDELKKSVKDPIAIHLKQYSKKAETIINDKTGNIEHAFTDLQSKASSYDTWNPMRIVRDFVVVGGALTFVMVLSKFFH